MFHIFQTNQLLLPLFILLGVSIFTLVSSVLLLNSKNSIQKKIEKEENFLLKQNMKEFQKYKISLFENIDIKLSRSGLKYRFHINIYMFTIFSVVSGIIVGLIGKRLINDFIFTVFSFSGGLVLPYALLDWIAYFQSTRVKKQVMSFVAIIINNIKIVGDIYNAIIKTASQMEQPLKQYLEEFELEYQSGVDLYKCFQRLKEKVADHRFSRVIDVLLVHYVKGGKPEVTLSTLQREFIAREVEEDRKRKQQFANIIGIFIVIGLNVLIVSMMGKFMPEFFDELKNTNYKYYLIVGIINIVISLYIATRAIRTKPQEYKK